MGSFWLHIPRYPYCSEDLGNLWPLFHDTRFLLFFFLFCFWEPCNENIVLFTDILKLHKPSSFLHLLFVPLMDNFKHPVFKFVDWVYCWKLSIPFFLVQSLCSLAPKFLFGSFSCFLSLSSNSHFFLVLFYWFCEIAYLFSLEVFWVL